MVTIQGTTYCQKASTHIVSYLESHSRSSQRKRKRRKDYARICRIVSTCRLENGDRFLEDMKWLGNLQPDIYPRATDVMPDIINLARDLLTKGWAYERNGTVYFKVHSYEPFGRLSKLPEDQWLITANERGNRPEDPNKRNPTVNS